MKPLLFYSDLVLYAQGWINFKESRGFLEDISKLCKRIHGVYCEDPILFILNACSQIKTFCIENKINYDTHLDSAVHIYLLARDRKLIYNNSWEECIVKVCLELLMHIPLKDVKINRLNYKKDKLYIKLQDHWNYKQCQEYFDKQFSDNLEN